MGFCILLVCAFIWGTAFVAQKTCADHLGPFAITCLRSVIAGLFLLAAVPFSRKFLYKGAGASFSARTVKGGAICGIALFLAQLTQQIGIVDTTSGISAFLTANYIILVPIIAIFAGRKPPLRAFVWALLALAGTYFICIGSAQTAFSLGRGESWTLLCAVLFASQILLVDRYAPGTDVIAFSCVQQFTCMLASAPFLALATERANISAANISAAFGSLMYVGLVSSGIAYTLQNIGQTKCPPALASIVMSLESAIGALAGYFILGDVLSSRQIAGCAILFSAVVASQVCGLKPQTGDKREHDQPDE